MVCSLQERITEREPKDLEFGDAVSSHVRKTDLVMYFLSSKGISCKFRKFIYQLGSLIIIQDAGLGGITY